MIYYHSNKREILQKEKDRYFEEKAADYCLKDKEK